MVVKKPIIKITKMIVNHKSVKLWFNKHLNVWVFFLFNIVFNRMVYSYNCITNKNCSVTLKYY